MNETPTLSAAERRHHDRLQEMIHDLNHCATRLETAIQKAEDELNARIDLAPIAKSLDPLSAYYAAVQFKTTRRLILRDFVNDMPVEVTRLRAGIEPLRVQQAEIREIAAQRAIDIKMLEQQMLLDGGLPDEQRRLLLDLKAKAL